MEYYYHIYNRGAHKAEVFLETADYWRMLYLLYIANNSEPFEINDIKNTNIFLSQRKEQLVDIIAYCLMPNHFHIFAKLRDVEHPENITRFLRKLCTGYTNYYNIKYKHSGTIWQGTCKKKDVLDNIYAEILIQYIHLNPYSLIEPNKDKLANIDEATAYCKQYEFSSFKEYLGEKREQSPILSSGMWNIPEPPKHPRKTTPSSPPSPSSPPHHLEH